DSSGVNNTGKIPDYLALSKNENTESSRGFLQGVNTSDSAGPYIVTDYYSDSLSFQLLYVSRAYEKEAITFDSIQKAELNGYKDFVCYTFVYPMLAPDKMKDYHNDNVTYPVNVKCYVRKVNGWKFLSESKVNDLRELSQYKIKCIYATINK
ncbi:MAG: hypothetical protein DI539_24185, partial [Flavobacterium psychrophilum]